MNKEEAIINEELEKPKKKYYYGDKYKGRYKETLKKIYERKKDNMTDDDILKVKEYNKKYYQEHKDKFIERSKANNKRVKEALKLLKNVENGIIKTTIEVKI